jgi:hypothetical protein
VSKDSDQTEAAPRKFKLGPLANLNQVTKGLAKTIRAMADGTLDSQVGARICNGLGIMRACLEAQAQGLAPVPTQQRRIMKIVHEIVHVTETQEQIDNEIDGKNLVVDYRETEAINGHGSNGHGSEGDKPVLYRSERVGRHQP